MTPVTPIRLVYCANVFAPWSKRLVTNLIIQKSLRLGRIFHVLLYKKNRCRWPTYEILFTYFSPKRHDSLALWTSSSRNWDWSHKIEPPVLSLRFGRNITPKARQNNIRFSLWPWSRIPAYIIIQGFTQKSLCFMTKFRPNGWSDLKIIFSHFTPPICHWSDHHAKWRASFD